MTLAKAAEAIAGRGGRVFLPMGAGEPLALYDAYRAWPELAANLTFVAAFLPGVNRGEWANLHPAAKAEGTFPVGRERFTVRPLTYFQTWRWLASTPLDTAVLHLSPPDGQGMCSLGVSCDLAPAVAARKVFKVGIINPQMPVTDGPKIPFADLDLVVEADHPLVEYDAGALDPAFDAIARHIAGLTPDHATVQFGIGKVGVAALAGLSGHKGLRIHSGMVTDPLLAALDSGAVEAVTTGLALGSRPLYDRCASDPRIRFAPVSETHDIRTLAAIPRLVAVNSALEVDLFGQANAEFMGGRQVSGVGGLTDFLRGAALSDGGVPIVALNATTRGGSVSRITPRLEAHCVSVPRADLGVVVTEHGAADLRGLSLEERAGALIAIAAPQHRQPLERAWAAQHK